VVLLASTDMPYFIRVTAGYKPPLYSPCYYTGLICGMATSFHLDEKARSNASLEVAAEHLPCILAKFNAESRTTNLKHAQSQA